MARIRLTGGLLIIEGKRYIISNSEPICEGDKFVHKSDSGYSIFHYDGLLDSSLSTCSKILASEDDGIIIGNLLRGLKKENGDKIDIICNVNEIL